MTTTMLKRTLTLGDTFTLPASGGAAWTLGDGRAHTSSRDYTVRARCEKLNLTAWYSPTRGWFVPARIQTRRVIFTQLSVFDVRLPHALAA